MDRVSNGVGDPRTVRPPGQVKSGAGRHTLGSDLDAPGTRAGYEFGPVPAPDPKPLSRPVWWLAAQERARDLDRTAEPQRVLVRLLAQLDAAWPLIREMETLCRTASDDPAGETARVSVIRFLEGDVCALFLRIAAATADLLSTPLHREREAAAQALVQEIDSFGRYLAVLNLAAQHPDVPSLLSNGVRRIGRDLLDWHPEASILAAAAAAGS